LTTKKTRNLCAFTLLTILSVSGCLGSGSGNKGPGSNSDEGLKVTSIYDGTVTKVHDGDSIHITPPGKKRIVIRLAAIDAPEIDQKHGIESRDYLRSRILNKRVSAHCNKVDKYRRHVCVVWHNNEDTNLAMLKNGNAWYFERFKKEQSRSNRRAYSKAATAAKKARLGLWKDPAAVAPWDFRDLNK